MPIPLQWIEADKTIQLGTSGKKDQVHKNASLPFMEVFVDAPLAAVESRDPKGLYKSLSLQFLGAPLGGQRSLVG